MNKILIQQGLLENQGHPIGEIPYSQTAALSKQVEQAKDRLSALFFTSNNIDDPLHTMILEEYRKLVRRGKILDKPRHLGKREKVIKTPENAITQGEERQKEKPDLTEILPTDPKQYLHNMVSIAQHAHFIHEASFPKNRPLDRRTDHIQLQIRDLKESLGKIQAERDEYGFVLHETELEDETSQQVQSMTYAMRKTLTDHIKDYRKKVSYPHMVSISNLDRRQEDRLNDKLTTIHNATLNVRDKVREHVSYKTAEGVDQDRRLQETFLRMMAELDEIDSNLTQGVVRNDIEAFLNSYVEIVSYLGYYKRVIALKDEVDSNIPKEGNDTDDEGHGIAV